MLIVLGLISLESFPQNTDERPVLLSAVCLTAPSHSSTRRLHQLTGLLTALLQHLIHACNSSASCGFSSIISRSLLVLSFGSTLMIFNALFVLSWVLLFGGRVSATRRMCPCLLLLFGSALMLFGALFALAWFVSCQHCFWLKVSYIRFALWHGRSSLGNCQRGVSQARPVDLRVTFERSPFFTTLSILFSIILTRCGRFGCHHLSLLRSSLLPLDV